MKDRCTGQCRRSRVRSHAMCFQKCMMSAHHSVPNGVAEQLRPCTHSSCVWWARCIAVVSLRWAADACRKCHCCAMHSMYQCWAACCQLCMCSLCLSAMQRHLAQQHRLLASMLCVFIGCRPRLVWRVHWMVRVAMCSSFAVQQRCPSACAMCALCAAMDSVVLSLLVTRCCQRWFSVAITATVVSCPPDPVDTALVVHGWLQHVV